METIAATGYASPATVWGGSLPKVWSPAAGRSGFGDAMLLLFLLLQCFDGVFTYIGVVTFGVAIEANPIIRELIAQFGEAPALLGAKLVAGVLGIALHLRHVHGAVALLAGFYLIAAILPWAVILFL